VTIGGHFYLDLKLVEIRTKCPFLSPKPKFYFIFHSMLMVI